MTAIFQQYAPDCAFGELPWHIFIRDFTIPESRPQQYVSWSAHFSWWLATGIHRVAKCSWISVSRNGAKLIVIHASCMTLKTHHIPEKEGQANPLSLLNVSICRMQPNIAFRRIVYTLSDDITETWWVLVRPIVRKLQYARTIVEIDEVGTS